MFGLGHKFSYACVSFMDWMNVEHLIGHCNVSLKQMSVAVLFYQTKTLHDFSTIKS